MYPPTAMLHNSPMDSDSVTEIPNLVGASGRKNRVSKARLLELARSRQEEFVERFTRLESFVTFIGYPRSGHSLVGSLLDAHSEAIIGHELDAYRLIDAGANAEQLWTLIMLNSQQFSSRDERTWGPHQYDVPGYEQGFSSAPRVIGDKQGARTTIRLARKPALIAAAETRIPLKHRFIHCLRNPFDNIATLSQKDIPDLPRAARAYFSWHQVNARLSRKLGPTKVFTLYHEDLVAEPRRCLAELCDFLDLEAEAEYLDACAGIVYEKPHQSRHRIDWPEQLKSKISETMQRLPMLRRYSFDD
jgi:hypothetical protein